MLKVDDSRALLLQHNMRLSSWTIPAESSTSKPLVIHDFLHPSSSSAKRVKILGQPLKQLLKMKQMLYNWLYMQVYNKQMNIV